MDQEIVLKIKKFGAKNKRIKTTKTLPVSVFFSNRKSFNNFESLAFTLQNLPRNAAIIIREYDLNTTQREAFAKDVIALARPLGIKILIGKNIPLAKKLKAKN